MRQRADAAARLPTLLTTVLLACSSLHATAQGDASAHGPVPKPTEHHKGLESKVSLLNDLVRNSPSAQRIQALSGKSRAHELLTEARAAAAESNRQLVAGDEAAAERAANSGLRAFSAAARLVVDPEARQRAERSRYYELNKRVSSFNEAFDRIAKEKGGGAADNLLDRGSLQGLVSSANVAANAGDYETANRSLVEAAARVEVALTELRKGETLFRELRFDSPAEEYEYEKRRNHAYVLLLDMLERQQQIPESQTALVAEMVRQNETMLADAESQARTGLFPVAIKKLESGTGYLIRALRGSGLQIP